MSTDELFEMVRAAYERGYNWGQENPDSRPFLNKAAYDYADKTTSALALRTPSDGEVVACAQFLIDRLDDFERGSLSDDIEDACRDFDGHVSPAIERLRSALTGKE